MTINYIDKMLKVANIVAVSNRDLAKNWWSC